MRYFIALCLFVLSLPALAQTPQSAWTSCYSECINTGGVPAGCNRNCIHSVREEYKIPAQPAGQKKLSNSCYNQCTGGGRQPAECAQACTGVDNSQVPQGVGTPLAGAGISTNTSRQLTPGQTEEGAFACIGQCLKGNNKVECIKQCTQAASTAAPPEALEGLPAGVVAPGVAVPTGTTGDFSGVDYGCFKQCRTSGDGYDTCKSVCGR